MAPTLEEIRQRLAGYEPRTIEAEGVVRAAVAVVLHRAAAGPELLLIERARRPGDPWSGQMAFPGGRIEPQDATLQETATRETEEEVGVVLQGSELLGRLDDLQGRPGRRPFGIVISAYVYHLERRPDLRLNREVESAFWVSLRTILDPESHTTYRYPLVPDEAFPAVVVGEPDRHVVWGLTYRFLQDFFSVLELPFGATGDRSE